MLLRWAIAPFVLLALRSAVAALTGREPSQQEYVDLAGVLAAGLALSTRSLTAHVLGRGVLWFVFARALLWLFDRGTSSAFFGESLIAVAAAAAALVALHRAHPALEQWWARAAFAPVAYRRTLLAAATACSGLGATMLLIAGLSVRILTPFLICFNVMGALLLVAGVGIARMRAWGVLLAAACGAVALGLPFAMDDAAMAFSVMPALPGMWASPPRALAGALPLAPACVALIAIAPVVISRARARLTA